MKQHWLISCDHPADAVFWVTACWSRWLSAAQMLRINIDTDPENMLPAEQADRVFHNQVEERVHAARRHRGRHRQRNRSERHLQRSSHSPRCTSSASEILKIDGVMRPDLMSLAEADNITQGRGTDPSASSG